MNGIERRLISIMNERLKRQMDFALEIHKETNRMKMDLSLMSFSFQVEALFGMMNAEKLCTVARQSGMQMLDLTGMEIRLYRPKALLRAFEKTGISCGCVIETLPFYKGTGRFEKKLDEAISLCRAMKTQNLMIVPGDMDAGACRKLSREEMLQQAIRMYTVAVARGRKNGIEILFEDTPQAHKPLSSAEDCRTVLDGVEGLDFAFDTANFLVAKEDTDVLEAYELLKDRIRRVHLKDVVRGHFRGGERCANGERIRSVVTGTGMIPMQAVLEKLQADGYDGALCVEYAAAAGVHGLEHAKALEAYTKTIRTYWEREDDKR